MEIIARIGNSGAQEIHEQILIALWTKKMSVEEVPTELRKNYSFEEIKKFASSRKKYDRSLLIEGALLLTVITIAAFYIYNFEKQFLVFLSLMLLIAVVQVALWLTLG